MFYSEYFVICWNQKMFVSLIGLREILNTIARNKFIFNRYHFFLCSIIWIESLNSWEACQQSHIIMWTGFNHMLLKHEYVWKISVLIFFNLVSGDRVSKRAGEKPLFIQNAIWKYQYVVFDCNNWCSFHQLNGLE